MDRWWCCRAGRCSSSRLATGAATRGRRRRQPLVAGGICVSPGAAAGPVVRVERDSDALRFPEGAVLVVSHPLPKWAALLPRAVAVVSAEGGIAGHLATVARESGVPALFQWRTSRPWRRAWRSRWTRMGARSSPASISRCSRARPRAANAVMAGSPVHETLSGRPPAHRTAQPARSGRSRFPAVVLPNPARHHPFLSREGGAGDVRFRQEPPLPASTPASSSTTTCRCSGGCSTSRTASPTRSRASMSASTRSPAAPCSRCGKGWWPCRGRDRRP